MNPTYNPQQQQKFNSIECIREKQNIQSEKQFKPVRQNRFEEQLNILNKQNQSINNQYQGPNSSRYPQLEQQNTNQQYQSHQNLQKHLNYNIMDPGRDKQSIQTIEPEGKRNQFNNFQGKSYDKTPQFFQEIALHSLEIIKTEDSQRELYTIHEVNPQDKKSQQAYNEYLAKFAKEQLNDQKINIDNHGNKIIGFANKPMTYQEFNVNSGAEKREEYNRGLAHINLLSKPVQPLDYQHKLLKTSSQEKLIVIRENERSSNNLLNNKKCKRPHCDDPSAHKKLDDEIVRLNSTQNKLAQEVLQLLGEKEQITQTQKEADILIANCAEKIEELEKQLADAQKGIPGCGGGGVVVVEKDKVLILVLQENVENLKKQINELQTIITEKNSKIAALKKQIASNETEITSLKQTVTTLEAQIAETVKQAEEEKTLNYVKLYITLSHLAKISENKIQCALKIENVIMTKSGGTETNNKTEATNFFDSLIVPLLVKLDISHNPENYMSADDQRKLLPIIENILKKRLNNTPPEDRLLLAKKIDETTTSYKMEKGNIKSSWIKCFISWCGSFDPDMTPNINLQKAVLQDDETWQRLKAHLFHLLSDAGKQDQSQIPDISNMPLINQQQEIELHDMKNKPDLLNLNTLEIQINNND